jgi:hypothetical protein
MPSISATPPCEYVVCCQNSKSVEGLWCSGELVTAHPVKRCQDASRSTFCQRHVFKLRIAVEVASKWVGRVTCGYPSTLLGL